MAIDLLARHLLYLPLLPRIILPPPISPPRHKAVPTNPCYPPEHDAVYELFQRTQGAPSLPFPSFRILVHLRNSVTQFRVFLLDTSTRTSSTSTICRRE